MNPCRRRRGVLKALKVLKIWSSLGIHDYLKDFKEKKKYIRSMVNTRKPCSCSMCGNPRRNKWESNDSRITRQEKRAEISFKEQMQETLSQEEQDLDIFALAEGEK